MVNFIFVCLTAMSAKQANITNEAFLATVGFEPSDLDFYALQVIQRSDWFKMIKNSVISSARPDYWYTGISSNIMKSPSPKCYMTFWDMTIYNDTLNWSDITPICEFITELDFNTDIDLITEFWRFP